MPGKDGVQLANDLRAAGVESPIVFLTAYPQDAAIEQAAQLDNVFWVLAKPFDPQHLTSEVTRAIALAQFSARSQGEAPKR